ncbi:MAG: UPF0280 family protein [Dehalobacterium sp.]
MIAGLRGNRKREIFYVGKRFTANHAFGSCFNVEIEQTKLFVAANHNLYEETKKAVLKYRKEVADYIRLDPQFLTSLSPIQVSRTSPSIIKEMAQAGEKANVGPMAAVAGAIAEKVGVELLNYSSEVIVENGGDIFLSSLRPIKIAIYAGRSPLSLKLGLQIESGQSPLGICTSAGTVGPSLSFGKADAICVVSRSVAIADAYATAIGNMIHCTEDLDRGVEIAKRSGNDIIGLVMIFQDNIAMWGGIKIVPI